MTCAVGISDVGFTQGNSKAAHGVALEVADEHDHWLMDQGWAAGGAEREIDQQSRVEAMKEAVTRLCIICDQTECKGKASV